MLKNAVLIVCAVLCICTILRSVHAQCTNQSPATAVCPGVPKGVMCRARASKSAGSVRTEYHPQSNLFACKSTPESNTNCGAFSECPLGVCYNACLCDWFTDGVNKWCGAGDDNPNETVLMQSIGC